jgi:hypothetical protein
LLYVYEDFHSPVSCVLKELSSVRYHLLLLFRGLSTCYDIRSGLNGWLKSFRALQTSRWKSWLPVILVCGLALREIKEGWRSVWLSCVDAIDNGERSGWYLCLQQEHFPNSFSTRHIAIEGRPSSPERP